MALESILMGVDGWVTCFVCAFLAETVTICNLLKADKTRESIAIYRWFLPLLELDINTKLVQNIKLAEVVTVIGTENVLEPSLSLIGK